MKNQTTVNVRDLSEKNSMIAPELTRALRAAIRSNKLNDVLARSGAPKVRGAPAEILEELAAAQTATWVTGPTARPFDAPSIQIPDARLLDAATQAVDQNELGVVARILGLQGSDETAKIHKLLVTQLAHIAYEAARYANSESRPLDESCVAVGGFLAARVALLAASVEKFATPR